MNKTYSEANLSTLVLATAAGATNRVGLSVDVRGYLGVAFQVVAGTIESEAEATLVVHGSHDGSTWVPLAAELAIDEAMQGKIAVLDMPHPRFRYLRPSVTKGDGSTTETVVAIRYRSDREPLPQSASDMLAVQFHALEEAS